MNQREEIRIESRRRMAIIEESYGALYHLPNYVMATYRLYALLAEASIQRYVDSFGLLPIDVVEIGDAKSEFNWGDVTDFEREVILLLNEVCRRGESMLPLAR